MVFGVLISDDPSDDISFMKLFYRDIQIHTNEGDQFSIAASYEERSPRDIVTFLREMLDNKEGTITVFPYEDCFEMDGSPLDVIVYDDFDIFLEVIRSRRSVHGLYIEHDSAGDLSVLAAKPTFKDYNYLTENDIRRLWEVYGILRVQGRVAENGFADIPTDTRDMQ